MRDLYKVLGIAASADDVRIKTAFRSRAMRTHPDLNPGSKDAEEQFRELWQAYEVLRDAHARALYDAHLAERRRDAWRRFTHSAAVMVATFLLTTSSAIFVLGQQGISVHSETWQIATAWLTSVEVEPAATDQSPTTAAQAAAVERNRRHETEITASPRKAASKTASATSKTGKKAAAPAPVSAAEGQRVSSWPTAAEPFYGLGASDLK